METKKRALGKGLEQLFDLESLNTTQISAFEQQVYNEAKNEEVVEINLDELRVNPYQPRKVFDEEALEELANSIKEYGVFQPIIVKKSIKGYEIIAGERRVRASKKAGKTTIPALVRQLTDEQMAEIALLENLQRENLNVLEEAKAYKMLIEKLNITQDELSKKVSKSRSHITNIIGILRLPQEVQKMIEDGKLSMGHARVLSKLDDEKQIVEIAHKIVENKLSVRELEKQSEKEQRVNAINKKNKNNEYCYVEELLRDRLDTKIKIKDKKLVISFTNTADLNRILEILNVRD